MFKALVLFASVIAAVAAIPPKVAVLASGVSTTSRVDANIPVASVVSSPAVVAVAPKAVAIAPQTIAVASPVAVAAPTVIAGPSLAGQTLIAPAIAADGSIIGANLLASTVGGTVLVNALSPLGAIAVPIGASNIIIAKK